jgi:hypothetical protein
LRVILESFDFEEDDELSEDHGGIKWDDDLIRKFNGEVRKAVLQRIEPLRKG